MPDISPIVGLPSAPISIVGLLLNLAIGGGLSFLLMWHYNHFSHSLSNRASFSRTFPLIILTTLVVISVVKSSLALSLGLVGALSIVRFRTPIKEPEELAYLFVAIAIGLGLGADQRIPIIAAFFGIMGIVSALQWARVSKDNQSIYLSIVAGANDIGPGAVNKFTDFVSSRVAHCTVRRVDTREESMDLTLFIMLEDHSEISTLLDDLKGEWPQASATLIDQTRMPTI